MRAAKNIAWPSVNLANCGNHTFLLDQSDKVFSLWRCKGLTSVKDFYTDGKFATFDHLQNTFTNQFFFSDTSDT